MNAAGKGSASGHQTQLKHKYHPVGRIVDVFCKSQECDRTTALGNVGAGCTSQSDSQSQHGIQQAESNVVEADRMSEQEASQLPGVSSNGSSFPEARTSFQSSTPKTVMTTSPSSRPSLQEPDQEANSVMDGNHATAPTEDSHTENQQNRDDSISEELSHHFSSEGNISPLLASTPVKGTTDGRNVSLTKMLMSSDQFCSIADSCSTDSDTTMFVNDSSGMEEKPIPPKNTPSKENLRNTAPDGSIPLEKQTSISHLDIPPARLDPTSSAHIIEKYSAPGALSDFAHPYGLERPSTESTHSLKSPEQAFAEFGIRDMLRNKPMSRSLSKELQVDRIESGGGGSLSDGESRCSQQDTDDQIQLQRLDSEVRIRTVNDTDDVQHVQSGEKVVTETRTDVLIDKNGGKLNEDRTVVSYKTEHPTRSERNILSVTRKSVDQTTSQEKKVTGVSDFTDTKKQGSALGRGSSISEFKTAAKLLHEKQRKLVEKKIDMQKQMARAEKLFRSEKNSPGSLKSQSSKFDDDSKSPQSEKNPSVRTVESNVLSHLSGEYYTVPLKHLQKYVNRIKTTVHTVKETNSFAPSTGHSNGKIKESTEIVSERRSSSVGSQEPSHLVSTPESRHQDSDINFVNSTNSAFDKGIKQQGQKEFEYEQNTATTESSPNMADQTPQSDVLKANQDGEACSPDYGQIEDTTLQHASIAEEGSKNSPENKTLEESQKESESSLPDYTTPSQLLSRHQEHVGGQEKSPGYGAISYTTPSELMERREQMTSRSQKESVSSLPDYTTPSQLLSKHQEHEGGQEKSPGYGAISYTTPSELMERREQMTSKSQKESVSSLPDYTTPSQLLSKHQEHEGGQEKSPGYGAISYTTPSELMEKREQIGSRSQKESVSSLPDYTTPSQLLSKPPEHEGGQEKSPGYGAISYTTPSELMERREQMTSKSQKESVSSLPDYTTPSQLPSKPQEQEGGQEKSPGYGAISYTTPSELMERREQISSRSQKESVSSLPDYTTPSQLLSKHQEQEGGQEKSPGYGAISYTTPSELMERREQMTSRSQKESVSSLPDYTTPSQLPSKHQEQEGGQEKSPGYGAISYTTPSELMERREQMTSKSQKESVSSLPDYTTPSQLPSKPQEQEGGQEKSPGYGAISYTTPSELMEKREQISSRSQKESVSSLPDYTTPSQLLSKPQEHEGGQEKSPGYGAISYTTPSELMERREQMTSKSQKESVSSLPDYTTPSQLPSKPQEQEGGQEKSPGYGAISYTTPSELMERREQISSRSQKESVSSLPDYTTPSQLLSKHQEHEGGQEKSPGYGAISYTTPSELMERREQMTSRSQKESVSSLPDYTTPSQLPSKPQEQEGGQEKSPGYGAISYTTPSELMERREHISSRSQKESVSSLPDYTTPSQLPSKPPEHEGGQEKSPGYGAFSYTTPSELMERLEQIGSRSQKESVSSLPDYTTPSQLLSKHQEHVGGQEKSPGYGAISYTTPSELMERREQMTSRSQKESVSSLPDYTTPSQLLSKHQEHEGGQEKSPGYGAISYTTPSELMERREQMTSKSQEESVSSLPDYTTPSQLPSKPQEHVGGQEKSPGYGAFSYTTPSELMERREQISYRSQKESVSRLPDYTTPSQLRSKHQEHEGGQEKSPGYGAISYTSPSELMERREQISSRSQKESVSSLPEYTTPSQLLSKHQEHVGGQEKSPGYGAISYTTPSELMERREQISSRCQKESVSRLPDYTTPSQLPSKHQEHEGGQEKSPGYGAISYTSPSELMERREQMTSRSQKESVSSLPDYTTPSQLLSKHQEHEGGQEKSPGYGTISYTTPSELMERREQISSRSQEESCPGYSFFNYSNPSMPPGRHEKKGIKGESTSSLDYTTPSLLLKKHEEYEKAHEDSHGYGAFDYCTPSQLVDAASFETTESHNAMLVTNSSSVRKKSPLITDTVSNNKGIEILAGLKQSLEQADKDLLEETPSRLGQKQLLDLAMSDLTAYYFRTLSEILKSSTANSHPLSEPELMKLCSQYSVDGFDSFMTAPESSCSSSSQRRPMSSQQLSSCNCGSFKLTGLHHPTCKLSETNGAAVFSRNTSIDTGFESFSSLSYPDSFLSSQDSRFKVVSNPSFMQFDEEEYVDTQDIQEPSTSTGLHSALSANEMFWELYYSNPGLAQKVLGPEFAEAIKALGKLYRGSSSSILSSIPSNATNPDSSHYPATVPSNPVSPVTPSCTPVAVSSVPAHHSQSDVTAQTQEDNVDVQADESRSEGQLRSSSSKTGSLRSASPDVRNFLVEKEKLESQMRKLQVENSTLLTENKLVKEKFNRATVRIGELEQKVCEAQDEMEVLHTNMTAEISSLCDKTRAETKRDIDQLQARVVSLTHHNESLQSEVAHLQRQLESAQREMATVRVNADKSRAVDGFKIEVKSLKNEVDHVKQLLQQSECQVKEEMDRAKDAHLQVIKLTEVRNLLQQQLESGGTGTAIAEKQVQALEQRLRVTEDRLHQERADRANTLSTVEEKLLAENARLQCAEKELTRKLQREKDKARNLDQRCRELKVENENLRLSQPLDESCLIKDNNYDIPNKINSTHRQETKQVSDIKYILSEVERETGLTEGQEKEIICHLWNTSCQAQRQLRQWEINLQELEMLDEDVDQGLQNLREMKAEYELKMREVEEKLEDIRSEKIGFESMYKEQLSGLVKEKHEACARLKTLEDMMDALRKENDTLRLGLSSSTQDANIEKITADHEAQIESLTVEIKSLEGKTSQLERDSKRLETEVETLKAQLMAKDSQLEEAMSELEMAKSRTEIEDPDDRKQQKIIQLTAQVSSLQDEVRSLSERLGVTRAEKSRLERQVEDTNRQLTLSRSWAKENKAGGSSDAKVSLLESELAQKDSEVIRLSSQYRDVDTQLQHTKQDLFFHQQHISDLETQVESLEQQLVQRGHLLDTVNGKEKEQLQQFQMVKDSLDAVTNSLNQRTAEFKVIQTDLTRERNRREALEKQVRGEEHPRDPDADIASPAAGSAMEIRVQEMEAQADRLRGELVESASVLQCKEEELSGVRTELAHTRDDLEREKALSCQLAAEKVALQQQLQAVVEDRNCLHEEKDQAEEDLVKLESKLQEVVHKFQMDSSKQHSNFSTDYGEPEASEGKQMFSELKSLRLLVEGKEKEEETLNDRISRLQMETGFLHRRVELLHQENQYNKEDIHRLGQELIIKMKEKAATADLNIHLMREKTSLQQDNHQLARDVEREKDYTERRKAEVSEVIKKMELSESSQRSTIQELHLREGDVASLETDLRQARKENSYLEAENQQLKVKLDHLKNDVQKLTSINSTLDNRLEMERASVASEKTNYSKKKEELTSTQHKLDSLQHEQSMLLNNLSAERKMVEQLRGELSSFETSEQSLREQINSLQVNLEGQQGQNLALRDNLEQVKKEKTSIFHEYQGVCRQLGEKEKQVHDLTDKCERQVDSVRRDAAIQRSGLDQERAVVEKDLIASKEEINELNEKLRQKDIQLSAFGRTLTELEDTIREKKSLEMKLEKLESTATESKYLLESHRAEIVSLKETNSNLQESLAKTQMAYHTVQEQLKSQSESTSGQMMHLKQQLSDAKNQQEGERAHFREALNQAESNLRSVEMNLKNTTGNREQVVSENKNLARTLEEIRGQLSEEIMTRKLLQQKMESLQGHIESVKKKKQSLEEKLTEMHAKVAAKESELRMERERVMTLTGQNQDFEASVHGNQSALKAKQEQVEILQSEIGKLQQLLDSQKHQLGGKFRRANLDLKQQFESCETEKNKLSLEAQQLSVNLEQAREQLAIKNRENLKLQEDILLLEDQVRDNSSQLKQAQESLRMEEQLQKDLNSRFSTQEEELKRLRAFLAKKAEEGGDDKTKGMWQEMNRVIQDLSREMHQHLEGRQHSDKEARDREIKLSNSYKKQISKLDSELKTERALHQITKSSAKALEEDNARLRQQLLQMRRKSATPEKKQKSRSEEINEIIARSQSRAHAMLSSGSYLDGTFRNITPTHDYNTNHLDRSQSPDTASQISDISYGSSSPVYLAFLNSSGNFPGNDVTPKKSPR